MLGGQFHFLFSRRAECALGLFKNFFKTRRSHSRLISNNDKRPHKNFELSRLSIDRVNPLKSIITPKPEVLEDHVTT